MMFDTFRIINGEKQEFTYEQLIQLMIQVTKSRIDYIYTDQETSSYNLMKVMIKDIHKLLNTDHKMTYALLNVTEWTDHRTLNKWKSVNQKNINR